MSYYGAPPQDAEIVGEQGRYRGVAWRVERVGAPFVEAWRVWIEVAGPPLPHTPGTIPPMPGPVPAIPGPDDVERPAAWAILDGVFPTRAAAIAGAQRAIDSEVGGGSDVEPEPSKARPSYARRVVEDVERRADRERAGGGGGLALLVFLGLVFYAEDKKW